MVFACSFKRKWLSCWFSCWCLMLLVLYLMTVFRWTARLCKQRDRKTSTDNTTESTSIKLANKSVRACHGIHRLCTETAVQFGWQDGKVTHRFATFIIHVHEHLLAAFLDVYLRAIIDSTSANHCACLHTIFTYKYVLQLKCCYYSCLQFFDVVGWVAGRASGL